MRDSGRLLGVVLVALAAAGCVPLTPYSQVRQRLPADSLIEIDGRFVHVEQRGSGPPLVLLHGFGGSTYSWRLVVPALAERYRTVAIDLNGFGYSARSPEFTAYTVAGQLQSIVGVLDALGIEQAHLAGHSYGGAIALHLAWRHPQRVRSLILVDSAGPEYPSMRRYTLARIRPLVSLLVRGLGIRRSSVRRILERSFADDTRVTDELVDAYFERVRIEGVSRAYRGLSAPSQQPEDIPDLARIDMPTLAVWGSKDTLVTPAAARPQVAKMPHAEFRLIDGVGHIPLEESPRQLSAMMLEFLDGLERRRSAAGSGQSD